MGHLVDSPRRGTSCLMRPLRVQQSITRSRWVGGLKGAPRASSFCSIDVATAARPLSALRRLCEAETHACTVRAGVSGSRRGTAHKGRLRPALSYALCASGESLLEVWASAPTTGAPLQVGVALKAARMRRYTSPSLRSSAPRCCSSSLHPLSSLASRSDPMFTTCAFSLAE